jgi:cytochrome oxidase assembly protein ShyY1
VRTPGGQVRVEGIALERIAHALEPQPSSGKVRQNVDIAAFAGETGLQLEPLVIEQHSDSPDGLLREWPRPDLGIEKHEAYSLQWYSFAALALVLGIVLSFRRVTQS